MTAHLPPVAAALTVPRRVARRANDLLAPTDWNLF